MTSISFDQDDEVVRGCKEVDSKKDEIRENPKKKTRGDVMMVMLVMNALYKADDSHQQAVACLLAGMQRDREHAERNFA